MSKEIKYPYICECGFNTMDAKEAVEHSKKHEVKNKKEEMLEGLNYLIACTGDVESEDADPVLKESICAIRSLIENMDKKVEAPIICLCGSTRFTELMLIKQWELTKQGYVVLSWCALPDSYFDGEDKTHIGDQEGVKEIVDEVHLRKINLADEVFILNVGGYIGESTARELAYAKEKGKEIKFLESLGHEVEKKEGDGE